MFLACVSSNTICGFYKGNLICCTETTSDKTVTAGFLLKPQPCTSARQPLDGATELILKKQQLT